MNKRMKHVLMSGFAAAIAVGTLALSAQSALAQGAIDNSALSSPTFASTSAPLASSIRCRQE